MITNAGGYRFDEDVRVEPGALPAVLTHRGSAVMGLFLMVFSVVWFGAVLLIAQALFAEPFPVSAVPFVFAIPAAGLFVAGLRALLLRIEVTIDRDRVTVRERRWFRTASHEMALADYPGVLRARVTYSRNKRSRTVWLAVLPHARGPLRIVLAATHDEAEGRRLVEDYARWLDKPALEESTSGFVARAPGDLDTPVGELAARGKVESGYRPGRSTPAHVRVETRPDMIVVSLLKGTLPLWLGALLAGIGAAVAFVFVGYGEDRGAQVVGGLVGLAILAAVLWIAFSGLRTTRQILVTRDRVALAKLPKDGTEPVIEQEMRHDEIEGVRVARGPLGGTVLWLDTDRGSFHTGANMPRAALDHVRDLIVAALATAGEGPPSQEAP